MTNYELLCVRADLLSSVLKRPIDYLEIGVFEGGSAEAVLQSGRIRRTVLVDLWLEGYCGSKKNNLAQVSARLAQWAGIIKIMSGDSRQVVHSIREQFDLIFVDGGHTEDIVTADLRNAWTLLRPSGIMVVDDVDNATEPVRVWAEAFAKTIGVAPLFLDVHCGVFEFKK